MGLFIELTKTILCSLDVVYKEAQKLVNNEREMKTSITSLITPSYKSTTSKDNG